MITMVGNMMAHGPGTVAKSYSLIFRRGGVRGVCEVR